MRFERARCLLARERLDDDNRVIRIVSLIDRVRCFRAGCRFDAGKLARCDNRQVSRGYTDYSTIKYNSMGRRYGRKIQNPRVPTQRVGFDSDSNL